MSRHAVAIEVGDWANREKPAIRARFQIRSVTSIVVLRPASAAFDTSASTAMAQPARHSGRNDCVHDPVDLAKDDDGPTDADLLASPLPSKSASIFRAREAGTRAFNMRFSRPGTTLERFLSRPLRPSDTHCSTLIGFSGIVFGSKPNFPSTAVSVNPAASTVTQTPRGLNS